jgi:geranylgeranyl diphosphate synthase type II
MPADISQLMKSGVALTDAALERLLPGTDVLPHNIHRAMRHSVFAGGKRLRPLLAIEAARMIAGTATPPP